MNYWNAGQVDSRMVKNDNLMLYYQLENENQIVKKIYLKPIL